MTKVISAPRNLIAVAPFQPFTVALGVACVIWKGGGMTFYIEYSVPTERQEGAEIPVSEQESGYTVPLTETDAPVVRANQLPARSSVTGADLDGAKTAAELVLSHSKAKEAKLFEDEEGRLESGSGKLTSVFDEGEGWTDV